MNRYLEAEARKRSDECKGSAASGLYSERRVFQLDMGRPKVRLDASLGRHPIKDISAILSTGQYAVGLEPPGMGSKKTSGSRAGRDERMNISPCQALHRVGWDCLLGWRGPIS